MRKDGRKGERRLIENGERMRRDVQTRKELWWPTGYHLKASAKFGECEVTKFRFPTCCGLENAIFHLIFTKPGRNLLVVPCRRSGYWAIGC